MLEIYKLLKPPHLYPRKLVRAILNPDDLIKKMGWTKDQVSAGLNGDVVNNMIIQFSDHFLRRVAIDEIIAQEGTHTSEEVAQALGISDIYVRELISNARKKIRDDSNLYHVLKRSIESRAVMNTYITINFN